MPNPVGEVQRTQRQFSVIFLSPEKLGMIYDRVNRLGILKSKKERAAELRWLDNTLRRLGLIPSGPEWATYAIAVGMDFSGNTGVFVLQEPVEIIKK